MAWPTPGSILNIIGYVVANNSKYHVAWKSMTCSATIVSGLADYVSSLLRLTVSFSLDLERIPSS